jgi:putative aldouronate transport system permease protein
VGHWNSWFDGLIIMRTTRNYPLQTYLQTTIVQQQWIQYNPIDPEIMMKFSERAWKCAQIVVASIPILAVYPFLQRYFVTMRIGGIKG